MRIHELLQEDYVVKPGDTLSKIAQKQNDFHVFLKTHAGGLGQAGHETVFQLLQSHGKINECIRFAEDVGAHEAVIMHYINK